MAPEEALAEVLQVPLGCVTPFALVNESARHVSLLLDQGFKTQECCFFHPLSNDTTIGLSARGLDKFLSSTGKQSAYVDLEANPPVGKDQPPDLASLLPSDPIVLPNQPDKTAPLQGSEKNLVPVKNKSTGVPEKAVKPSADLRKEKSLTVSSLPNSFANPDKFVEDILERISSLVLSEVNEKNIKLYGDQLGETISNNIRKKLVGELRSMSTIFKNMAYTEGFLAGTHRLAKQL